MCTYKIRKFKAIAIVLISAFLIMDFTLDSCPKVWAQNYADTLSPKIGINIGSIQKSFNSPPIRGFSTIATSESTFHFFLFLSFCLFVYSTNANRNKFLILAGLSIGLASLCRYEGLLFIPMMGIYLYKKRKQAILFTVIAIIPPLIWMAINYYYFGDFLKFLNTNNVTVQLQYNWLRSKGIVIDFFYKLIFWPNILISTLGIPLFICGVGGIVTRLYKKEGFFSVSLIIFLFFIFIIKTLQEQLYFQSRYAITLGLMLIPFSFYLIVKLVDIWKKKYIYLLIPIILVGMILPIEKQVRDEAFTVPSAIKKVARYIKKYHTGNIMIDHCGDEKYTEPIKLLSEINPRSFILPPYEYTPDGKRVISNKKRFLHILDKYNITLLISSPDGGMNDILDIRKEATHFLVENFTFKLKYISYPFFIYEVKNNT